MANKFQSYNNRIDAWVEYKVDKKQGSRITRVKKSNPTTKFKGVPVKR